MKGIYESQKGLGVHHLCSITRKSVNVTEGPFVRARIKGHFTLWWRSAPVACRSRILAQDKLFEARDGMP